MNQYQLTFINPTNHLADAIQEVVIDKPGNFTVKNVLMRTEELAIGIEAKSDTEFALLMMEVGKHMEYYGV